MNTQPCPTDGCKANLPHRWGIHSWWCPAWRPEDKHAQNILHRFGVNVKPAWEVKP